MSAPSDGSQTHQRQPGANERQPMSAIAVGLHGMPADDTLRSEHRYRWITVAIILLFWIVQYGLFTIEGYMQMGTQMGSAFGARAIISAWGVIFSFGMVQALDWLRARGLGFRAAAAVGLAICSAAVQTAIIVQVLTAYFPPDPNPSPLWLSYAANFFSRLWVFACFGGISVALSYAVDIREREQRIFALQALAHSAQLRALRFQLNPHFLFNALNSVAGLISAKRVREAETMTENLADFLRLALALDPHQLITLDEELRLQRLYLDLEQMRFPDRLIVTVDVCEAASRALVPSLVLQPLVENSIKYAVAMSTEPVSLSIAATVCDDMVEVVIENSAGNARPAHSKGAHIGLKNVAERIRVHFGGRGEFTANPRPGGGFYNVIRIPLQVSG